MPYSGNTDLFGKCITSIFHPEDRGNILKTNFHLHETQNVDLFAIDSQQYEESRVEDQKSDVGRSVHHHTIQIN
jgi:hypothetical protein